MVGNGPHVRIWDDLWLLNGGGELVSLDRVENAEVSMVSDLIDHANGTWDVPRLPNLFSEDVIRSVLAIPVGDPLIQDELVWRFSKNGIYSSRPGYVDGTSSEEGADLGGNTVCWSLIWELDVPPKVRFIMWKLVHGILPTSINLLCRFVDVDPLCCRCGRNIETEEHLFHTCAWVASFWESNTGDFMQFTGTDGGRPVPAWVLESLAAIPDSENRAVFAVQLWNIWFSINQLIF
ncbi:hypothetical protein ACS0TY_026124 [Phlomoides rotata]